MQKLSAKSEQLVRAGFFDMEVSRAIPAPSMMLIELASKFVTGMLAVRKQMQNDTPEAVNMANAFDAPACEISDQMVEIVMNFKIPIQNINELGNVINFLDDNIRTKRKELKEIMTRIGGASKFLKQTK